MLYMYVCKSDQKYYSDKLTHARDLVAVKTLNYHALVAIQPWILGDVTAYLILENHV